MSCSILFYAPAHTGLEDTLKESHADRQVEQLQMPGIPPPARRRANANARNVGPGTAVLYVGFIPGGLRHGSRGVVRRARGHRASVDMGRSGVWHIPYHMLSVPAEAA